MKEYKRAAHNKFLSIAKYGLIKTNEDLPDNEDLRIPRISIHLVNRVSGFEMDLNSREILYTTTRAAWYYILFKNGFSRAQIGYIFQKSWSTVNNQIGAMESILKYKIEPHYHMWEYIKSNIRIKTRLKTEYED